MIAKAIRYCGIAVCFLLCLLIGRYSWVRAEEGDVLPESSTRHLAAEDLYGLDAAELRIARNEIYARHGRQFASEDLQAYFGSKSWYNGTIAPENFDDNTMLNDIEKQNLQLILKVESGEIIPESPAASSQITEKEILEHTDTLYSSWKQSYQGKTYYSCSPIVAYLMSGNAIYSTVDKWFDEDEDSVYLEFAENETFVIWNDKIYYTAVDIERRGIVSLYEADLDGNNRQLIDSQCNSQSKFTLRQGKIYYLQGTSFFSDENAVMMYDTASGELQVCTSSGEKNPEQLLEFSVYSRYEAYSFPQCLVRGEDGDLICKVYNQNANCLEHVVIPAGLTEEDPLYTQIKPPYCFYYKDDRVYQVGLFSEVEGVHAYWMPEPSDNQYSYCPGYYDFGDIVDQWFVQCPLNHRMAVYRLEDGSLEMIVDLLQVQEAVRDWIWEHRWKDSSDPISSSLIPDSRESIEIWLDPAGNESVRVFDTDETGIYLSAYTGGYGTYFCDSDPKIYQCGMDGVIVRYGWDGTIDVIMGYFVS